jgi:hypothetical protein
MSQVKCLTLVDCKFTDLQVMMDAINAEKQLETLVIIFNEDQDILDDSDDEIIP